MKHREEGEGVECTYVGEVEDGMGGATEWETLTCWKLSIISNWMP
jgi:hypothetical protein